MRAAESLDFKLGRWAREARELATCVECYGVGEDRHAPGRACPACNGSGRAVREPHVLELLELVRSQRAEIVELGCALEEERRDRADATCRSGCAEAESDELRRELDRVRCELHRLRDDLHQLRAASVAPEAL